jgi:hypothetical protein
LDVITKIFLKADTTELFFHQINSHTLLWKKQNNTTQQQQQQQQNTFY